jgi:three prime repair exonuclease-1
MSPIKTFVFLDLETTGLPHLEHNLTKITELCAVSVQADHIELGVFPRVHNKLNLCFNPHKMISPDSTEITGLSNDLLEHQALFCKNVVEMLTKWLEMNRKPICLVAHNGNRFDFPILRREIESTCSSLPEDLLCIDSLAAFRDLDRSGEVVQTTSKEVVQTTPKEIPFELDDGFDELLVQAVEEYERSQKLSPAEVQKINETTPHKQIVGRAGGEDARVPPRKQPSQRKCFSSYKLQDVYSRVTCKEALNAHEAEGDVVMLITCAAVYGERFVAYANEKSKKFSDMPMMKPGRKIGT